MSQTCSRGLSGFGDVVCLPLYARFGLGIEILDWRLLRQWKRAHTIITARAACVLLHELSGIAVVILVIRV